LNGSVTASSVAKILNSIHVPRHAFVDLGAGDGRVILSALAMGANKAVGFDFPENLSHGVLFCAARHMLQSRL
jgi:predicted RNA methylase